MNTYDNYKTDTFKTTLTTSMYIDLGEDDELVYIVFRPSDDVDKEHALLAEVFTAYKKKGNLLYQFGLPCNHGDEIAVIQMQVHTVQRQCMTVLLRYDGCFQYSCAHFFSPFVKVVLSFSLQAQV